MNEQEALIQAKLEQVDHNFTYHQEKPGQHERYVKIREQAKKLAFMIVELSPLSREQSLALTHLETAVMFANAGIARNE